MKSLAIVLALLATPAFAQSACAPRAALAALMEQSGSTLEVTALLATETGIVPVEFWRNVHGAWLMFSIEPDGTACMGAGGPVFNLIGVGL
jgi:hypothetical protein